MPLRREGGPSVADGGLPRQLPAVSAQLGQPLTVRVPRDRDVVDATPPDDGPLDRGGGHGLAGEGRPEVPPAARAVIVAVDVSADDRGTVEEFEAAVVAFDEVVAV